MPFQPDILYLHGFRSSPDSVKARAVAEYLRRVGYGGELHIPTLHTDPEAAYAQIEHLLTQLFARARSVALIGSSLGGYFAALFAERFDLRAALINPAVYPYELLTDYCGMHTNMYTGEVFEVTREHLRALRQMDRPVRRVENLFVLVQTGDEVLDYRQAIARFEGARFYVGTGGDHSFSDFETHLPDIMHFLCKKTGEPC